MNNKAQVGPVGAIIMFGMFLIMWFVFLGGWLNTVGQNAILTNNVTGIEAFFYSNLNFVVFIAMLCGMMGWIYFGSAQ